MTDEQIRALGFHAESLLQHDSFLALWDHIVEETGKDMLRTNLDEGKKRDDLYLTYHGMRFFLQRMGDLKNAADSLRTLENQEVDPDEGLAIEDEDLDS